MCPEHDIKLLSIIYLFFIFLHIILVIKKSVLLNGKKEKLNVARLFTR